MRTPLEARKHWAAVLRTDRFKQGFGGLEYIDNAGITRNCCLGVACRLYIEDGGTLTVKQLQNQTIFESSCGILPEKVMSYLGLNRTACGRLKTLRNHNPLYLTDLNDEGKTFSEIADIIDNNELDTLPDIECNEQTASEPII